MQAVAIAAIVVSVFIAGLFALLAWKFNQSSWMFLLMGRLADTGDHKAMEKQDKLGKRMALVLAVSVVLILTLVFYDIARLANQPDLAWGLGLLNNVVFLAEVAVIIWFFIAQRFQDEWKNWDERKERTPQQKYRERIARINHLSTPTILFITIVVLVLFGVGYILSAF